MFPLSFLVAFFVVSVQPTLSAAYSWRLDAAPKQCSNLSIAITATSDGQPPYRVLIIPTGPSPLANGVEVRQVIEKAFDDVATSISFPLNYPANSKFVAVISDAAGFGTGGTSLETRVEASDDASCFNPAEPWSPPFTFSVGTDNQIVQCQPTRIWWNESDAEGVPTYIGAIPGGRAFSLPEPITTGEGRGFEWTPSIRGNTTLLLVGGDGRGMGTGGWARFTVQPSGDASCLSALSPSSTPRTPPGQFAIFVGRDIGSTLSGKGFNIGIIVGAAVGGLVGIMALITCGILSYYCLRGDGRRSRRLQKRTRSNVGGVVSPPPSTRGTVHSARKEVLSHYNPEPFSSRPSTVDFSQTSVRHGYDTRQGFPGMRPGATPLQPMSRLANTSSGGLGDAYSQFGYRYGLHGATPGLRQEGSFPSITSGSGVGVVETSSQAGSGYGGSGYGGSGYGGSPTVTSRSSYPILARPVNGVHQDNAGPSEALPGYPVSGLSPRNDVKLKIRNP